MSTLGNIIQRTAQAALKNESDDLARLAAKKAEQEALESGADILGQSPSMAKMHEGFQSSAREADVIHALNDPLSARASASAFGGPIPEALPQLPQGNGVGTAPIGRLSSLEDTFNTPNAKNSASVFGNSGLLEPESTVLLPRGNPDVANRRADAFAGFTDPSSARNSASAFEANGLGSIESSPVLPRGNGMGALPRGAANADLGKVTPEVFDKMSFLQKYGRKGAIAAGLGGAGILGYNMMQDDPTQASAVPAVAPAEAREQATPLVEKPVESSPMPAKVQPTTTKPKAPVVDEKAAMEAVLAAQANQFKDTEAGLRDVQQRENQSIMLNQLGKSANLLGSSIAGVNPIGQELFDSNIEQAKNTTKQYAARMEKANNDPKSGLSVALRQQLKSLGINAPEGMSASDLVKVVPGAQALYTANQNRMEKGREFDLRNKELGLKREELRQSAQDKITTKKDTEDKRRIDKFGAMVAGDAARGGAIGVERRSLNNINHAKSILNGTENLDDVPDVAVVEIAKAMDRVISGGSPTVSTTHELTPQNAKRYIAQKLQQITSNPGGAGQAGILNVYNHMLDRQEAVTKKNIAEAAFRLLGPAADLKDHPNMQNVLLANQLPEDTFDYLPAKAARQEAKDGVKQKEVPGFSSSKSSGHSQENKQLTVDPQIVSAKVKAFMAKNPQVTDPKEAEEILKKHGRL